MYFKATIFHLCLICSFYLPWCDAPLDLFLAYAVRTHKHAMTTNVVISVLPAHSVCTLIIVNAILLTVNIYKCGKVRVFYSISDTHRDRQRQTLETYQTECCPMYKGMCIAGIVTDLLNLKMVNRIFV